jgi:hypothetical protein
MTPDLRHASSHSYLEDAFSPVSRTMLPQRVRQRAGGSLVIIERD